MVIWGSKRKLKKLGTAADFCPICRRVQPFEISQVNMVKHVYYIPMGGGKVVGHLASCQECSVQKFVDAEHYASYAEQSDLRLEDLIRKTNPDLKQELAERLPLEKKIWNKGQLSADERRFLISEPFHVISPMLELRYRDSLPLDKTTGRSCLLTLIIPLVVLFLASLFYQSIIGDYLKLVGYTLGVMGVLTTVLIIFTTHSRYLDRSIYPLFARALYPLNPSMNELNQAVLKYKELGMLVGRKIKPQKISKALQIQGDISRSGQ